MGSERIRSIAECKKTYRLDYESRAETVDILESYSKQIHVRDVLNDEWVIAMFDSGPRGVRATSKRCVLVNTLYMPDPEDMGSGKASLSEYMDLTEKYQSCKGIIANDNRHLLLLSNETTLCILDLQERVGSQFGESCGKYDLAGQSNVKMFSLKR